MPEEVRAACEIVRIVEADANDRPPLSGLRCGPSTRGVRENVSPDQQARIGENEAIFREVNETVAAVATETSASEPVMFLCECASESCAEGVLLLREEYEQVRAVPERFLVTPGHVQPQVERVVEQHRVYWVVEKFGEAAEVAEETDPRADE
jgi:hypothetical protein